MAEEELAAYITEQLATFTTQTLGIMAPPAWAWSSEWLEPYYLRSKKTIFLPKDLLVRAYVLDPEKTKMAIKGSLGHEFWHYVQDIRGDPLVIKGIKIADIPTLKISENIAQRVAIKRAVFLTGISHAEHLRNWEEISNMVITSFIKKESPIKPKTYKITYLDAAGKKHVEDITDTVSFYQKVRSEGLTVISIKG